MIGLQKRFCHQNLCHVEMNKIKGFYGTKQPTKVQIKKCKIKMSQWINDDKSVYFREDLANKIIHYINLGVIKADEFRKNLGVKNDQSIRIEREMIAMVMKIFEKEKLVRQYQIPGLRYRVDLYFAAHKLVIDIDENGYPYYERDEIRQELIENLGFTFIRINPDPDPDPGFDPDIEIAKIYNYIDESSLKLVVNVAEKSLKEKLAKELLSYISSISKPLNDIKYFIKNTTYLIYNG